MKPYHKTIIFTEVLQTIVSVTSCLWLPFLPSACQLCFRPSSHSGHFAFSSWIQLHYHSLFFSDFFFSYFNCVFSSTQVLQLGIMNFSFPLSYFKPAYCSLTQNSKHRTSFLPAFSFPHMSYLMHISQDIFLNITLSQPCLLPFSCSSSQTQSQLQLSPITPTFLLHLLPFFN